MSFGFSVGDIIACTTLAVTAYQSLRDAPKEFEGLRLEVLSLNATLRALEEEATSPNSIILLATRERQENLRVLLENTAKGLQQLQKLTGKFPSLGLNEKRKFLEHVKFSLQNKNGPREKLAIHTASINIFLTSLTHSSLGRLEGLIKNAIRGAQRPVQPSQPLPSGGFEKLGDRNLNLFRVEPVANPPLLQINTGQIWNVIAQDVEWEGIRLEDVEAHKDEIVAYIRYLHKGGPPFWKRGMPEQSKDDGGRRYEQTQVRGSAPTTQPPYQQQQPPPAYSVAQLPQQQISYGTGPNASYGAPQQQPLASMPNSQGRRDSYARLPNLESRQTAQNSSLGSAAQGDEGLTTAPGTTSPSWQTLEEKRARLEKLRQDAANAKKEDDAKDARRTAEARTHFEKLSVGEKKEENEDGRGSSPYPISFGNPSSNALGNPSTGYQSAAPFASPASVPSKTTYASGVLFGKSSASTSTAANNGGGLFGTSPQTHQSVPSVFGNPSPHSGGAGFGSNATEGIFKGSGIDEEEEAVHEMADLFDHMFDVDDAETAIARGTTEWMSQPPSSIPYEISPKRTFGSVAPGYLGSDGNGGSGSMTASVRPYNPRTYVEQTEPRATEHYQYHPRAYVTNITTPEFQLPPAITANTPLELQRARLKTVKTQLEGLLERIFAAHRASDTKTPYLLLTSGPHNDNESPIHTRVAYLRASGVAVINCDICTTPVPDYHWHCAICAKGDWDCCFRCRTMGHGCPAKHSYLERRSARAWESERYWTNL